MEEEWKQLYEQYVDDVYKFLVYFTGNRQDAEDLTQETFFRAYQKLHTIREDASRARAWLIQIARNLAVDRFRKSSRTKLLQNVLQRQPIEPELLPEEWLGYDERRRALYQAILRLEPHYRAVMIVRGIQDCSPTEAAEMLGWDVNKVNVYYHRGLKKLRSILEREVVLYEAVSR